MPQYLIANGKPPTHLVQEERDNHRTFLTACGQVFKVHSADLDFPENPTGEGLCTECMDAIAKYIQP